MSADRVLIKNNLNLNNTNFKGTVRFNDAQIGGACDCSDSDFTAPPEGCDEGICLSVDGASISGDLSLSDCRTTGDVRILGATVKGRLDLSDAVLTSVPEGNDPDTCLCLDETTVSGGISLKDATCKGTCRFIRSTLGNDLDCDGATFIAPDTNHENQEKSCCFNGRNMHSSGNIYFSDFKSINGSILLTRASIDGGLHITGDFSEFSWALDLRHAKAGYIEDQHTTWPSSGNLYLHGFTYESISEESLHEGSFRTKWLGRLPLDGRHRPQPYEQLAKVLRESGYDSKAKRVCIERRKARAQTWCFFPWNRSATSPHWRPFHLVWDLLARLTVGYGYQVWRPVVGILVMITLGYLFFDTAHYHGNLVPFQESRIIGYSSDNNATFFEHQATLAPYPYPEFSSLWYSIDTFIPLIDLHQETFFLPDTAEGTPRHFLFWTMKTGAWLRHYLAFHIISGWILTSLFIVGLTGMMRKDE